MLADAVHWEHERCDLRRDAANVNDEFWVRGAGGRRGGQEMRNGELRDANRVGQVDVEQLVSPAERVVLRFGRAGRVPEIGPMWFEDAGAGADDVKG